MAEEGKTAFEIYAVKANREHIKFTDSFIPGFRAFVLDTDIQLGLWRKVMHPGVYFLKIGDEAQTALVYTANFNPEQLKQIADSAEDYDEYTDDDGARVKAIRDEARIDVSMEPLEMEKGRYLSFMEANAWLAITTEENEEIRKAIFDSAYKVEVHEKTEAPKPRGTSAGSRQMIVSRKPYQYAMTPLPNENCFIAKMTDKTMEAVKNSGDTSAFMDGAGDGWTADYEQVKDLDLPLLNQLLTATLKSGLTEQNGVVTVDFNKFTAEMGKDAKAGKAQDVIAEIRKFEECVGVFPQEGKMQRVLTFMGYDSKSGTMNLAVPYLMTVINRTEESRIFRGKTKAGELYTRKEPAWNKLCHSEIVKERNKVAVSLVYELTNRLLQLGNHPDETGRTTYRVKYRTLIEAVPALTGRIQSLKATSDKNKALKRAFESAFKILRTRTDCYEYFDGLHLSSELPPTMETIDKTLRITHRGTTKKDAD